MKDIVLGDTGYRITAVGREGVWTARARRADNGDPFGIECVDRTESAAVERLAAWLDWQHEHAAAIDALQHAERAYHRTIAGGAFASDVIRSGILAIDPGIIEAAEVSGLSKRVIFTRIVLPIALRTSIRPLGSVFINLILTSSILSTITLNELTGSARIVVSDTFRPFEVYVVLLLVYAALTYLISILIGVLHYRLNRNLGARVT